MVDCGKGTFGAMTEVFTFVTLMRLFYSTVLVFLAIVLLREVWFIWFDRQVTFGEVKYFDGIKVEQGAADRFRHLLNQEYNQDLGRIRNHGQIYQTITGRAPGTAPDLLQLEGPTLEPATLVSASAFERFAPREQDFAALDLSFQGIEIKKLFSSVRTYLSPSVDLNILVTKGGPADEVRANIRWPREGRRLAGLLGASRTSR
jgi:hypothetical protein